MTTPNDYRNPQGVAEAARQLQAGMSVMLSERSRQAVEQAKRELIAEGERRATAAIVAWLRVDNGRCDCSARSEGECACGAWSDYKQLPLEVIADRIEAGEAKP
jgi:hypothetical protein